VNPRLINRDGSRTQLDSIYNAKSLPNVAYNIYFKPFLTNKFEILS